MKRIDIIYGGAHYSVAVRIPTACARRIEQALRQGQGWIRVNEGGGRGA